MNLLKNQEIFDFLDFSIKFIKGIAGFSLHLSPPRIGISTPDYY